MKSLTQGLSLTVRSLAKDRVYMITALVTLTLCLGANTIVFGVVDSALLVSFPYPDSDRLVRIYNSYPRSGVTVAPTSASEYYHRRQLLNVFEHVAAYQCTGSTIRTAGGPERVSVLRTTPEFVSLLGYDLLLGRSFTEQEIIGESSPVAILTYGFWQDHFGGDEGAIGQTFLIDAHKHEVIGILPREFRFVEAEDVRLLLPVMFDHEDRNSVRLLRNQYGLLARLTPQFSIDQAKTHLEIQSRQLVSECDIPNIEQILDDAGFQVGVQRWSVLFSSRVRPMLLILWGSVVLFLVLGLVNTASLTLVRSHGRLTETGVRIAVGARHRHLFAQPLSEGLVLAISGGVLALGIGAISLDLLRIQEVADIQGIGEIGLSAATVMFTLGIALLCGLILGLVPLSHLGRLRPEKILVSSDGGSGRSTARVQRSLVTIQVAVTFALISAAGLLGSSLNNTLKVDAGFQPQNVLTATITLPPEKYSDSEENRRFIQRLLVGIQSLPGVESCGFSNQLPFSGRFHSNVIVPVGYEPRQGKSLQANRTVLCSEDYLNTMKIPVLEGRHFTKHDTRVVIIDRRLGQQFWANESPVGKQMYLGVPGMQPDDVDLLTVVGVVEVVKSDDLASSGDVGSYYLPMTETRYLPPVLSWMLAVRTHTDPTSLTAGIRNVVTGLDPDIPLYDVMTMSERVDASLLNRRLLLIMLTSLAAVALQLLVVGVFGALSFYLDQRTRELAIRSALGCSARRLYSHSIMHGMKPMGIGLGLGLLVLGALADAIRSQLYRVEVSDPVILTTTMAFVLAVGFFACALSARRVSKVDPVKSLHAP